MTLTDDDKLRLSKMLAVFRRDGTNIVVCQNEVDENWPDGKITVNDNYSFEIDYGHRTSYR